MKTSLSDEMKLAARGFVAILKGRRDAGAFFDFSDRGLAGSFIALLIMVTLGAYLPSIALYPSSNPTQELSASFAIFAATIVFVVRIMFGALALLWLGRMDGFVPYLVADNWVRFFIVILYTGLLLLDFGLKMSTIIAGTLLLVCEINISRLIVTLRPVQIALFQVAQLIGILTGLLLV